MLSMRGAKKERELDVTLEINMDSIEVIRYLDLNKNHLAEVVREAVNDE